MIPEKINNSIIPNLGRTVKMMNGVLENLLSEKGHNITRIQYIILHKLYEHNGVCQNDLAMFSNRNKSSLTRAINILESKNYIARVTSKKDKRINNLLITEAGIQILEKTTPVFNELSKIIRTGISEEEEEMMIKLLTKIRVNIAQEYNK